MLLFIYIFIRGLISYPSISNPFQSHFISSYSRHKTHNVVKEGECRGFYTYLLDFNLGKLFWAFLRTNKFKFSVLENLNGTQNWPQKKNGQQTIKKIKSHKFLIKLS